MLVCPYLHSSTSTDQQQQETLIEKYMQLPNQVWDDIINQVRHYRRGMENIRQFWKCVKLSLHPLFPRRVRMLMC